MPETWSNGTAYESYVGRWSQPVAQEFLAWIAIPSHARWLDVGCGTGALTRAILADYHPSRVVGVDPSADYVSFAQAQLADPRVQVLNGDATHLLVRDEECNVTVSGLVLNFIPQPELALAEMARVTQTQGTVAAYVWDYSGQMQLMRYFWNAVVALHPEDRSQDEGQRFPLCQPDRLSALWQQAGLRDVATRAIDVPTVFRDFDDYWTPFLSGQGPAPGYCMALSDEARRDLREHVRATLPTNSDGSISLKARAWAVQGRK
ncbi:MAG TPA: class I SAM-dependent methyltransferase [Ktedonobacterales bacterium]|nr:class I SAM-dependent methyltransferase [Ktedonobacterales bacterium]